MKLKWEKMIKQQYDNIFNKNRLIFIILKINKIINYLNVRYMKDYGNCKLHYVLMDFLMNGQYKDKLNMLDKMIKISDYKKLLINRNFKKLRKIF